jgi:hypothetical protein
MKLFPQWENQKSFSFFDSSLEGKLGKNYIFPQEAKKRTFPSKKKMEFFSIFS